MRRWCRGSLLASLCLAWAASSAAQDGSTPASVDDAWVKAMKANDVAAVLKCYAPDAVAWLPGMPAAQGAQAIRAAYEGLLSANMVKDATISNTRERMAGSAAVRWGDFTLTLAPKPTGEPVVMRGRFTEVLERRDGRWVYVVDHASAEPPPAAGTR